MKELALKYGCNPNQKPGRPFSTVTGSSEPSGMKMRAGFWLGLQPYLSCSSFIMFFSNLNRF